MRVSARHIRLPGKVVSRHSLRDRVQFCSGLVDLAIGVRHHIGCGHRLTLAGESFVRLFAEDIAEV